MKRYLGLRAGRCRETRVTDYPVLPHTRMCAASGRDLRPGERCYGVLVEEEGSIIRKDYAHESWTGPPVGAVGFWAGRVPPPEGPSRPRVDDESLLECFERLQDQSDPERIRFRYVVALLLMRRKRLRFEESRRDGEAETLILRCQRTRTAYEVPNPGLTAEEMAKAQADVLRLLGWE